MRILVLSDYIDGHANLASARVRFMTALEFAERGHEVTIISPRNREGRYELVCHERQMRNLRSPGVAPNRFRTGGFSVLDLLFKTLVAFFGKFDVVETVNGHRPAQFLPCWVAKHLRGALIVNECWEWYGEGGHADERRGLIGKVVASYDRRFEVGLSRVYDHTVAISTALAKRLGTKGSVSVIPGGSEDKGVARFTIEEARRKLGLREDLFILGMTNVDSSDDADNRLVFEAIKAVIPGHPEIRLFVTGRDNDYLGTISQEYALERFLISPGWIARSDFVLYLSACSAFVLPYSPTIRNEARWPNKLSDYLFFGRPILTNPTGDVGTLAAERNIGKMCEASVDGFLEGLNYLLANRDSLHDLSADCVEVATELSFSGRADRLLNIFRSHGERDRAEKR